MCDNHGAFIMKIECVSMIMMTLYKNYVANDVSLYNNHKFMKIIKKMLKWFGVCEKDETKIVDIMIM